MSLTAVGLPEPSGSGGPLHRATRKAAVVAAIRNNPAIDHARSFYIDPLLRWRGGRPNWPLLWPWESAGLAAELWGAHNAINAQRYCGPNDRGAYLRTVLCPQRPDLHAHFQHARKHRNRGCAKIARCAEARVGRLSDHAVSRSWLASRAPGGFVVRRGRRIGRSDMGSGQFWPVSSPSLPKRSSIQPNPHMKA